MKKLNDKYELERLIDYAEELKEKQRKKYHTKIPSIM